MRRFCLLALLAPMLVAPLQGCLTLDMAHNRRHFRVIREEFRELHQDIDKTFFGLDRYPSEE